MKSKTRVINLFGGPGVGKSTTAAGVFQYLKQRMVSVELVTEFAKDLVWQNSTDVLHCQPYIFGEQYLRFWRLLNKVDYIVTDSPLLLTIVYNHNVFPYLNDMATALFKEFDNRNFVLERKKPYVGVGRLQSEDGAKEIDAKIRNVLANLYEPYLLVDGDDGAVNKIGGLIFRDVTQIKVAEDAKNEFQYN